MTRERVNSLESDKRRLRSQVVRLQGEVDRLGPENARLAVALDQVESTGTLATILISLGGFLVSYATFTGKAADRWANVSAGVLMAGIGMMLWQSLSHWRRLSL